MCPRIGPNSTHIYIRLHPPKHLPEDERSFSRNVASLKNIIQDKTNCSSERLFFFCFENNITIMFILRA